ncbi:hypothetical protein BTVI_80992 [Pitangus sulphuratus]|nr:hypothetical protein BTVI_80992 [Pitangus sulphuratus]
MDHASSDKCGCQDVHLVTVGPLSENVLQGEIMINLILSRLTLSMVNRPVESINSLHLKAGVRSHMFSSIFPVQNPSPDNFNTTSKNKISEFHANSGRIIKQQSKTGKPGKEWNHTGPEEQGSAPSPLARSQPQLLLDSAQAKQGMISITEGTAAAPEDMGEANPFSKSYLN